MRQFLDFLPIVLFVVVYFFVTDRDIYLATAVLMAGTTAQVLVTWLVTHRVNRQLQITFYLVLILGGATVVLRDKTFIQWKPTVINWILAMTLIASQYFGKRNLLERMLGQQISLPAPVWRTLSFGWAGGFALAGVLNLVVAYRFSESFWVNYKLFGGFGLTLLYVLLTIAYLARGGHLQPSEQVPRGDVEPPARRRAP